MSELDLRELHDPSVPVPESLQDNVAVTTLSGLYNYSRRNSLWPLTFGLACCAIEMIATATSRYDLARFGMEVFRASPRQADLLIISGTVTKKMVVPIVRIYNQMAEPRYVLAMGACASGGGPFKEGYNVVSGIDKYLPVDVYVPGCPPTPQALIHGLIMLQKKMDGQRLFQWNTADLQLDRGEELFVRERYSEALKSFDRALTIDPNFAQAWARRGDTLVILRRYREAIDSYNGALAINPYDEPALLNLALLLGRLGQYKTAVINYDRLLELNPEVPEAWQNRAIRLAQLKRYKLALTNINQALRYDDRVATAWVARGIILRALRKPKGSRS
ncbi:MAG: NADH-quinone oxidoreductase subunit NuoB [Anaerolineae bacterium]|nr:NADH-quinone oxidoreductase subunit NuoB [Anaerolineae bacterium]